MTDDRDVPPEVERAVKPGHTLKWDPPRLMVPARRWTCTGCGDAALFDGSRVLGNATERSCAQSRASWSWLEGAR